ncbi:hypothetical protein A1F95_11148, partial [Pyrenophora tritici-repentis]
VDDISVGYFVLNNASNNDTAVKSLAEEFNFTTSERRLRCCCHILNLGAQLVIWGKDRSAYENDAAHLNDEEKYIDKWRNPIDSYIKFKLKEHSAATAPSRRRKNRELLPAAQPRLYVREGGLSGKDWATITEYIQLLEPFAEATRLLEGRGRHGRHGAI